MRQVILDTNAVRYFYQIECCNGEGVQDKVMKKYHFDKQKIYPISTNGFVYKHSGNNEI